MWRHPGTCMEVEARIQLTQCQESVVVHQWWYRRGKEKKDCALEPEKSKALWTVWFQCQIPSPKSPRKDGQSATKLSYVLTCCDVGACALMPCLSFFAVIKTMTKVNSEGKGLFQLTFPQVSITQGSQGEQPRGRSWSRDHGRGLPLLFLMACAPCFLIAARTNSAGQHSSQ